MARYSVVEVIRRVFRVVFADWPSPGADSKAPVSLGKAGGAAALHASGEIAAVPRAAVRATTAGNASFKAAP